MAARSNDDAGGASAVDGGSVDAPDVLPLQADDAGAVARRDAGPRLDASLPKDAALAIIAHLSLGAGAPILSMVVRGDLAVLGRAVTPGLTPELYVVRIEPPDNPIILGVLNLEASVRAVALEGTRVYVATSDDARELLIADVADPTTPAILGGFDAPGGADGISLDAVGTRVVLGRAAGSGAELVFLDATDPSVMSETGKVDVGADVNDVETNDSVAYIATSSPGAQLAAFNYRDPGAVVRLWSFDTGPGRAVALDVSERHLYVVTDNGGHGDLFEFTAAWLRAPTFVESLHFGHSPVDVQRFGGRVLVPFEDAQIAVIGGLQETPVPVTPLTLDSGLPGLAEGGVEPTSSDASLVATAPDASRVPRVDGGAAPVLRVERLLSADAARTLAFRNGVMLIGDNTGSLEVVRPSLAPVPTDRNGDGVRTVSALGDSNTRRPDSLPTWADLLPGLLVAHDFRVIDRGAPYASTWNVFSGVPSAADELQTALGLDAPDAVIAAFGTNDATLLNDIATIHGPTGERRALDVFSEHLLALRATARSENVLALVALTPPMDVPASDPTEALVFEVNHRLRSDFDPAFLVDFFSTMVAPQDYLDTLHLGLTGQEKRAVEAQRALEP